MSHNRIQYVGVMVCWLALASTAWCQLMVLPEQSTQARFAGDNRPVQVTFQNRDEKTAEAELHIRLHQTSSATTILLSEKPWKKLQVLPGQTVMESANVNFPAVKAETLFLIQWVEGTNKVLGKTEVLVYPTNLLNELKSLCGDEPLGVFDPQNLLKPLLKAGGAEISDFEDASMEDFHGKLAILGPFQSRTQVREGFTDRVKTLAGKGVALIWIQPPPGKRDPIKPSFYSVPEGRAAVVVVQATEVANLADNPQAQLNLIRFARLALHPEPPSLPLSTTDH